MSRRDSRQPRRAAAIIFAFLLLALVDSTVLACEPEPPDWWFDEEFTTEPNALPPGVSVSSAVTWERAELTISNKVATPVYFLAPVGDEGAPDTSLSVALPPDMGIAQKVSAGATETLQIEDAFRLAPALKDQNERYTERPADVAVPAPQTADLTLVYDDRLLTVPLTLTYKLNPDYDLAKLTEDPCPDVIVEPTEPAGQTAGTSQSGGSLRTNSGTIAASVATGSALLLALVAGWRLWRGRRR